jgi:release factor glutamine methyltransferase
VLREVAEALAASAHVEAEVRAESTREAQRLVATVLDQTPAQLGLRLRAGPPLAPAEADAIHRATVRRLAGEPLAYAVGSAAFRHLVLQVDPRVLIPRPETEEVVGVALSLAAQAPGGLAIDIGTGSGAIALSLAVEGRFDRVVATDLSADALEVARANARRVRPPVPVEFRLGADLAPVAGEQARLIVSNPPYIAHAEAAQLAPGVRNWEPPVALFAGEGGMARYHALLGGAMPLLEPGGWLVLEVDARRAHHTAELARAQGFASVGVMCDLSGRDRILVAQRPSDVASHPAVLPNSAGGRHDA